MTDIQMPKISQTYWRDSISLPEFPKLEESIKADVGIVGSGITGITAAYLLAKQNVKVVLLDSDEILNGTTGHTTAKITAQHGLIYDELIQHFGPEKALQYYNAAEEAKKIIEQNVDSLKIDCDYKAEDAILFTNSESYISQLENEKKAYDQLKIENEFKDNMPLNIPVKSALSMKNQAQFHPLKYLKALAEESVKNGAKIYEQTVAVDIEYNKHPSIITKDGHRVTCNYVIAASHFPFYDKESFYFSRMYAERSYIIAVKSHKKYPGGMYINAEEPTRSIRAATMNDEELWLIVGENHKTGQGKSTMIHYNGLLDFAKQKLGVTDFVYRWSAQDLTTLDKLPYIGPATKEEDNVLVATGFRKWGMTNGTIAAKILSDRVLDKDNSYKELFSPARFQADPSVRKFARINADVAKHMVKGKLDNTRNSIDDLSADDATVTRIKGKRTGVYKDKDNKIHMVDTTCTHLGCEVEWNSGEKSWDCPCHGSRFSYTGEVMEGPAKRPLKRIEDQ